MPDERTRKRNAAMLRYAGLGTQLLVLLGLSVWAGFKLDERLHFKALFVILLPVIALGYSLWKLTRSLNNDKNEL